MIIHSMRAPAGSRQLPPSRCPDLPAGMSPGECDGKFDPLSDAGSDELWRACEAALQVKIAEEFTRLREDDVRDALLEAGDESAEAGQARPVVAGRAIWRSWVEFRDRSLDRLHRRGVLSGEQSGRGASG